MSSTSGWARLFGTAAASVALVVVLAWRGGRPEPHPAAATGPVRAAAAPAAVPARVADEAGAWRAAFHADSGLAIDMLERGHADSAFALVDARLNAAGQTGAQVQVARWLLFGAALATNLDPAMAVQPLQQGAALAQATGDSATIQLAMRVAGVVTFLGGDLDGAARIANLALALARRRGDVEHEGLANVLLAYVALQRGEAPNVHAKIGEALKLFERIGNVTGIANARNTLGNVLLAEGDIAGARAEYERAHALCQDGRHERMRLVLTGNLGAIESRIGDPARAVRYYREALASHERRGEYSQLPTDYYNAAGMLGRLGRYEDADTLLRRGLAVARERGMGKDFALLEALRGEGEWKLGRPNAAKPILRAVLARGDSLDADSRGYATHVLARVLAAEDSLAAALAVLRANPMRARVVQELGGILADDETRVLVRMGRGEEALAIARPIAERLERAGDLERALSAWTSVVAAAHAAHRPDVRRLGLEHATRAWEAGRRQITDLDYREARGDDAGLLAGYAILEATDPAAAGAAGVPAAFERAQVFKTRTLLERMGGPAAFGPDSSGRYDPAPTPLADFRRHLADGELFLEYVCGADTTFLFAITRDTCRLVGLPGPDALAPRVDLAYDLCVQPGRSAGGAAPPTRAAFLELGTTLLGPVADLVGRSKQVIVAPDGPLHRLPFAALEVPGEGETTVLRRNLSYAPSAAVLARLRAVPEHASRRATVLAVAGLAGPGEERLRGAEDEVKDLARRFRNVEAWKPGPRRAFTPAVLADCQAFHYAGHTQVDDRLPWRSGLRVGRDRDGQDSLLTAREISRSSLGLRLVVLSSCQSAGGRQRVGEGVNGLSSAFLVAGAPAVLATLWPIDDRATETFMRHFYDDLAAGHTAAGALRSTQAWMQGRPATAAPFYWAGFVLIGHNVNGLRLEPRSLFGLPMLALIGIVVLAIASALVLPRLRRS